MYMMIGERAGRRGRLMMSRAIDQTDGTWNTRFDPNPFPKPFYIYPTPLIAIINALHEVIMYNVITKTNRSPPAPWCSTPSGTPPSRYSASPTNT